MISAALALAATLASLVAWWIRQRAERQESPENRYEQQRETIDQAIASGQSGTETINRLVERGIALRLRRASLIGAGDSGGPGNPVPPSGSTTHQSSEPLSGSPRADAGNPPRPLRQSDH